MLQMLGGGEDYWRNILVSAVKEGDVCLKEIWAGNFLLRKCNLLVAVSGVLLRV